MKEKTKDLSMNLDLTFSVVFGKREVDWTHYYFEYCTTSIQNIFTNERLPLQLFYQYMFRIVQKTQRNTKRSCVLFHARFTLYTGENLCSGFNTINSSSCVY